MYLYIPTSGRVLGEDIAEQSFKVFLEVFEEVY
jgi:hypothetical protein